MENLSTRFRSRFTLLAVLGRGGMGVVHRARQNDLDREVAIKFLTTVSPEGFERFRREARSLAALDHPGVVRLYSAELEGETPYLVMELVEGTTLRSALEEGLSPSRCVEVLTELGVAVQAAHDAGLLHRDIKPENVFVTQEGRVKLADFGLARGLQGGETVTGAGMILGTPAYLAPEQVRGERPGVAADQFALAVLAYEMLCGRLPWTGTGVIEVAAARLKERPASPSSLVASLPPQIDRVLLRALAVRPKDRFESVTAFTRELGALDWGTATRPPSSPGRSGPGSGGQTRAAPGRAAASLRTGRTGRNLAPGRPSSPAMALGVLAGAIVFAGIWLGGRAWRSSPSPIPASPPAVDPAPGLDLTAFENEIVAKQQEVIAALEVFNPGNEAFGDLPPPVLDKMLHVPERRELLSLVRGMSRLIQPDVAPDSLLYLRLWTWGSHSEAYLVRPIESALVPRFGSRWLQSGNLSDAVGGSISPPLRQWIALEIGQMRNVFEDLGKVLEPDRPPAGSPRAVFGAWSLAWTRALLDDLDFLQDVLDGKTAPIRGAGPSKTLADWLGAIHMLDWEKAKSGEEVVFLQTRLDMLLVLNDRLEPQGAERLLSLDQRRLREGDMRLLTRRELGNTLRGLRRRDPPWVEKLDPVLLARSFSCLFETLHRSFQELGPRRDLLEVLGWTMGKLTRIPRMVLVRGSGEYLGDPENRRRFIEELRAQTGGPADPEVLERLIEKPAPPAGPPE